MWQIILKVKKVAEFGTLTVSLALLLLLLLLLLSSLWQQLLLLLLLYFLFSSIGNCWCCRIARPIANVAQQLSMKKFTFSSSVWTRRRQQRRRRRRRRRRTGPSRLCGLKQATPSPNLPRATPKRTCNGLTRCRLVLASQVFPPTPQKKKRKRKFVVCVCVGKTNAKTCCPLEIITDKRDQQRGGSARRRRRRRPEEALYKPSLFFFWYKLPHTTTTTHAADRRTFIDLSIYLF